MVEKRGDPLFFEERERIWDIEVFVFPRCIRKTKSEVIYRENTRRQNISIGIGWKLVLMGQICVVFIFPCFEALFRLMSKLRETKVTGKSFPNLVCVDLYGSASGCSTLAKYSVEVVPVFLEELAQMNWLRLKGLCPWDILGLGSLSEI